MAKHAVLAGGSGFLGQALAAALVRRDYTVTILPRTPRAGGGLRVTVRLPAAPSHVLPEPEGSRRGAEPRSPVEPRPVRELPGHS